jgi:transketolase
LEKQGVSVRVVNFPWLNRVDHEWLEECVENFSVVVTLDNHYVQGGVGQMLLAEIARMEGLAYQKRFSLGITEVPRCGLNDEALKAHGLDAWSIVDRVMELMPAALAA